MPTNKLSDARCKGAKPAERPHKLFDGGGLYLYVAVSGARIWRLAFRLGGKPQTLVIGPYPEVGLAEARRKRDEVHAALREGVDPRKPKVRQRGLCLQEAGALYWDGRGDVSLGYRANAIAALARHIYPRLGERPINELTREEVLDVLREMDVKGLHVYVRKVRMWLHQVFDWAVEQGHATANPAAQIAPKRAFGKSRVEHFAALALSEVPEFMRRLHFEGGLQSVLACRMLAYTWTRTAELRRMEWREIEGDVWRIPALKMKRRREHLVPLPKQALELLQELRTRCRGSQYVFPSDRTPQRPMSENAILYLLHRMGYKGRMTGHGWRSVASTWANERGYHVDAIERQLAHAPEDAIRAVYNRAEYLPERREMLQAWADWLASHQPDSGGVEGG